MLRGRAAPPPGEQGQGVRQAEPRSARPRAGQKNKGPRPAPISRMKLTYKEMKAYLAFIAAGFFAAFLAAFFAAFFVAIVVSPPLGRID